MEDASKDPHYATLDHAVIPAGDTIHVHGIPFRLVRDAEVVGANVAFLAYMQDVETRGKK